MSSGGGSLGQRILGIIELALKVVIGLAIVYLVVSNVDIGGGAGSGFVSGVLEGIGGTISQLDDLIRDIRGASSA